MKVLITIFLFLPLSLFSQNWIFENLGNSFDGYKKVAYVNDTDDGKLRATLGVVNFSESRILTWGTDEKNGVVNLGLFLIVTDEISPSKILLAFDENNSYYIVNFTKSDKKISIVNAVSKDFDTFLSQLDIISYLKTKKNIHFRLSADSQSLDFSFPLKGSASAIDKSFICPSYKRAGNWTDAVFETLLFYSLFGNVDANSNNYSQFSFACFEYFEKEYGKYYHTQITSIDSKGDKDYPTLIFKNSQGLVLDELPKEIYLKNFYHYSGNPKKDSNYKLLKDDETIEIYYQAFKDYTDLIVKNNITLETFKSLTNKDLIPYYNALIKNKEFLEYVRVDDSIFYHYSEEEFTFKVFTEAWGRE